MIVLQLVHYIWTPYHKTFNLSFPKYNLLLGITEHDEHKT